MTSVQIDDSWGDQRPDPFWAIRVGGFHAVELLKSHKLQNSNKSRISIDITTKSSEAAHFRSQHEAMKFCGFLIAGGISPALSAVLIEPDQTP